MSRLTSMSGLTAHMLNRRTNSPEPGVDSSTLRVFWGIRLLYIEEHTSHQIRYPLLENRSGKVGSYGV